MRSHLLLPGVPFPVAATVIALLLISAPGEGVRDAAGSVPSGAGPRIVLAANAALADVADPAPDAAPSAEPEEARGGQSVTLTVGDGPLEVLHDARPLDLARDDLTGRYVAVVSGFVLVDARGTDGGWRLDVKVQLLGDRRGTVVAEVVELRAFARSLDGLVTDAAAAPVGVWSTVARDAAGNSAGCFEVSVRVTWDGPADGPSHVHGTLLARAA